jgi:hypothetical protein
MRANGPAYNRSVPESRQANFCLWLSLVFPSLFIVHKYLGWEGAIAYASVVGLVIGLKPRLSERLSNRSFQWLALGTLVVVVGVFVVAYPIANTHVPGRGSDDDDSIDLGVKALLAGRSPYAETSYLGNVLHHFPGAFVTAAPFVLLGTSALQNLFWLPMFFLAIRKEAGNRTALLLAWLVLAASPAVMHDVVTGTSYTSNTIYVLLGLWWLLRTTRREVAAVIWGVALASRANFLFLVPPAWGWLAQQRGWREAARMMALTCVTATGLVLPFYLDDPGNFTPLEAADRLFRFNDLWPHLGSALLAMMAALSVALAFTPMDEGALFRNCAWVQGFPVVIGVVLSSVQAWRVDLWYTRYGAFFAWFALMGIVIGASRRNNLRERPGQRSARPDGVVVREPGKLDPADNHGEEIHHKQPVEMGHHSSEPQIAGRFVVIR